MSKLTLSAVLAVLRVAIIFVSKTVRLIYSVIDLVDDGCLNASVPRPEWMTILSSAISTLESLSSDLFGVEKDVYNDSL